jgi:hypothetical protein
MLSPPLTLSVRPVMYSARGVLRKLTAAKNIARLAEPADRHALLQGLYQMASRSRAIAEPIRAQMTFRT